MNSGQMAIVCMLVESSAVLLLLARCHLYTVKHYINITSHSNNMLHVVMCETNIHQCLMCFTFLNVNNKFIKN